MEVKTNPFVGMSGWSTNRILVSFQMVYFQIFFLFTL